MLSSISDMVVGLVSDRVGLDPHNRIVVSSSFVSLHYYPWRCVDDCYLLIDFHSDYARVVESVPVFDSGFVVNYYFNRVGEFAYSDPCFFGDLVGCFAKCVASRDVVHRH